MLPIRNRSVALIGSFVFRSATPDAAYHSSAPWRWSAIAPGTPSVTSLSSACSSAGGAAVVDACAHPGNPSPRTQTITIDAKRPQPLDTTIARRYQASSEATWR